MDRPQARFKLMHLIVVMLFPENLILLKCQICFQNFVVLVDFLFLLMCTISVDPRGDIFKQRVENVRHTLKLPFKVF